MFPNSRPNSASVSTAKLSRTTAVDRLSPTSMQTIVKPNLAINALSLSKAIQLVTKQNFIREEYSDSADEKRLNAACRTKSIDKICEVSKELADMRTMPMGRPMSASVWNIKIPTMSQYKARKLSADLSDPVSPLLSSKKPFVRPPLFKTLSEKALHMAYNPSKSKTDIGSLLTVKSIRLNPPALQHKLSRQTLLSSSHQQRQKKLRPPSGPPKLEEKPMPFFNAVFANSSVQDLRSQGGLTFNFEPDSASIRPVKGLVRSQTAATLSAWSKESRLEG